MTRLPRRTLPGALALAGLLAGAVTIAAPASAETVAERDATRDVIRYDVTQASGEEGPESKRKPRHAHTDLKRWKVTYTHDEIRVLMTFRKLVRKGPLLYVGSAFKYPGRGQFIYAEAFVEARSGRWSGRLDWNPGHSDGPSCTPTHQIDYAADRVTMSIPAECLSSPRWFRFNAVAYTTDSRQNPSFYFVDQAPSAGAHERMSERIKPG